MSAQIQQLLSRLAGVSASIGVGAWLLNESLYNVDGGHTAIIWHRFNGGVQPYVVGEGSHFRACAALGRTRRGAPAFLRPAIASLSRARRARSHAPLFCPIL